MSIITRTNPLNLQYRVCIVTSASTPLGIIICKTLLKANALVLGVDSRSKHDSLNAGLGTHFQFEQCDINAAGTAESVLNAARERFEVERLDVLVNVIEKASRDDWEGLGKLTDGAVGVMGQGGGGRVINVLGGEGESGDDKASDSMLSWTRDMVSRCSGQGIRCNAIIPKAPGEDIDRSSAVAYKDAQTNMTALMRTEKLAKEDAAADHADIQVSGPYQIGNLTLFLAGDMSEEIAGEVVYLDGSHGPL